MPGLERPLSDREMEQKQRTAGALVVVTDLTLIPGDDPTVPLAAAALIRESLKVKTIAQQLGELGDHSHT